MHYMYNSNRTIQRTPCVSFGLTVGVVADSYKASLNTVVAKDHGRITVTE